MLRNEKTPSTIFKLRVMLGLDRPDFAERLNVTHSTIWNWERGKRHPKMNNIHAMIQLAKANDIPIAVNDFLDVDF